ncbi:MAG: NfeD family protein [Allosphingosinicella sp.]|uniref:NfeD family protein n=1 Tax=Allosphingosinicella sp. TaxID=2823234 RepID=UPI00393CBBC5
MRAIAGLAALMLGLVLMWSQSAAQAPAQPAGLVLRVDGAIGPATHDYVQKGLARAEAEGAQLAILVMDTPGGLESSMRDIIRDILRSPVPVVTYVHPSGGRATSAGAFILIASHVAAMTPGTNVGAATPVQLGGGGGGGGDEGGNAQQTRQGSASDAKAVSDAVAFIRSLAEMRGRNADWAESAVRDAESLTATAALGANVIDIVAADMNDLLAQLDGRTVTAASAERRLATAGLALVEHSPNWRNRLLAAITNPNIALILMMIGVYGLFFEFMNPGALYPGTIGAIALLLGFYALAALPVNAAGIGLILLGIALMAGEAFSPSFGILGIGGIIAFVLGAAILIDTDIPQFQVDWAAIAGVALFSAGATVLIARLALASRKRKVVSGEEQLIGAAGYVLDWADGKGHVFVLSERWRAVGVGPLAKGAPVRVSGIDGLVLRVEPLHPEPAAA